MLVRTKTGFIFIILNKFEIYRILSNNFELLKENSSLSRTTY